MKILILTTIRAPYRVNLFNEIGKYEDITVCFEQKRDETREDRWYLNSSENFNNFHLKEQVIVKKIKWSFLKELKSKKYDKVIYYEYSTKTAILGILTCIIKKIPYYINNDGAFISSNENIVKKWIKKIAIKNATGLLTNGLSAERYFRYYGATDNQINFHHFSSMYENEILNQPLRVEEKNILKLKREIPTGYKRVCITVGRLEDIKGIDILLSCWYDISSEILLIVIGSGVLERKLRKEYKDKKNIIFINFLPKNDLLDYYKLSDFSIIPTRGDVWGLVVNESMAMGTPVLSSNKCNAGIELIINKENGFIVKDNIKKEYIDIINNILTLDDEKLFQMGQNCIKTIAPYTFEREAKEHIQFLRSE